MYRKDVSLRRKLDRLNLAGPGAPTPRARAPEDAPAPPDAAPSERPAVLDDLRARMRAVLERSTAKTPPRAVDTTELPFVTTDTPHGPLHLRRLRLSPAHRTGRAPLLPARTASPELLALLALDPSLRACPPRGALYLDTETTGLSGGTGTVAFLVGLALWEDEPGAHGGGDLVVEQVLVRNLGEEGPMLAHVAARLREASMVVTFNGKAFDMPLLRTRFVMNRQAVPEALPHLDLLHVARRVHKPRGVTCKLTTIERDVLGFERHDDVPSGEVSACYLHFLRTGEARALLGVIEHNAWDVVAMVALVGLYGEPVDGSALVPDDLAGVARTLKRAGETDAALGFADAAVLRSDAAGEGGALPLRARAEIQKARGDRDRALADYAKLATAVDDPVVRLELAKLYEHHVKEPLRALALVDAGTGESDAAERKRRARLTKKAARISAPRETRQPELAFTRAEPPPGSPDAPRRN